MSLVESRFKKTHDNSLQPRALLDVVMRVFWNFCTENFRKYPGEMYAVEFLFNKI